MSEPAKTSAVLPVLPVLSGTLRVQSSSKVALGATTAALISLASGGTAVLVAHGTGDLSTPTSLPGGLLVEAPSATGPVVVDRAPGAQPAAAPAPDPTEQALREALTRRLPPAGPRTLVVPLVDLGDLADGALPGTDVRVPVLPVRPVVAPPATRPTAAPSAPPTAPPTTPPTTPPTATPPSTPPSPGPGPRGSVRPPVGEPGPVAQPPRGKSAEHARGPRHAKPVTPAKHAR